MMIILRILSDYVVLFSIVGLITFAIALVLIIQNLIARVKPQNKLF